ncbi:MAG: carotenoid 1,2-hydratase [Planctomycetes bacterium]|nr:carotenoid 1,2-hydratase [Planctomycetota bacterium]
MNGSRTLVLLLATMSIGCQEHPRDSAGDRLRLAPREALSAADDAGFERATEPREFSFPVDHGPHPAFRTEWWYVTGNLETADRRRFGYQLTIFRNALRAEIPARESAWATRDVWFAHFGLTDVADGRMHDEERFSRGALGLAGARPDPFRVWLEDWEFTSLGEGFFPLAVRARADGFAIDLELRSTRPLVLQGEEGLSRKSSQPGNASYYYSFTRIESSGTVRIGETGFAVTGSSWLDREWSTSALGPDQRGWDWFALQLDDGRDVMFYRLRSKDGRPDPASAGTLVAADGTHRTLGVDDVQLEVEATWPSPRGPVYPSQWRLRVPGADLDLRVRPVLADQEHDFVVRYWEGAVDVLDRSGRRVGVGYVELTGYD